MERINLKTLKVTHPDILKQIETRCYDRLDYLSRSIDDLKAQIREMERQSQYENEDLEACHVEMAQIEAETEAIIAAGNHFETVELLRTKEGHEYWVIQYDTAELFSYGYVSKGVFLICPQDFESLNEAVEAVTKRELALFLNESVMF